MKLGKLGMLIASTQFLAKSG